MFLLLVNVILESQRIEFFFCNISYSPALPPVGRWPTLQAGPLGPSSASSAFDGTCLMNAPSCGTSSQSGKRIPSPRGRLCPASVSNNWNQSNTVNSNARLYTGIRLKLVSKYFSLLIRSVFDKFIFLTKKKTLYVCYSINSSVALLSSADLCSSSCRTCSSLARSDQPPPAVDMVHLLCRDPRPRLVIRGDGDSVLPACRMHTQTQKDAHKHSFISVWMQQRMV